MIVSGASRTPLGDSAGGGHVTGEHAPHGPAAARKGAPPQLGRAGDRSVPEFGVFIFTDRGSGA